MSIYQPLPTDDGRSYLRLLRLHPGSPKDDIECALDTATHEDFKDQYEAISYCWGDAEDTVPLTCNGVRVSVTRNLHHALQRFRPPPGTNARLLWADALCINQEDDREKGEQVGRMGEVFAEAQCVLVWLGGDVHDATATGTCAIIREVTSYLDGIYAQCGSIGFMPILKEPYPICLEESKWLGVNALLESPWFGRVWTVQVDDSAVSFQHCVI
jgi:hypothetical protein